MFINFSGIKSNSINSKNEFYINYNEKIIYPSFIESTFEKIDDELINLEEVIEKKLFSNYQLYINEKDSLPDWVVYAGLDSDYAMDKSSFEKQVTLNKEQSINKHLYLIEFKNIINSTYQRILIVKDSLILFYKSLSEIKKINDIDNVNNGIACITGIATTSVFSHLHNIFISLYSTFDLLTKIAYEAENIKSDFSKYQKLSSNKILFGDKKKLNFMYGNKSIFSESNSISRIINIRNEIIHNGAWELNPKIFLKIENKDTIEKFILFPDNINGNLITYGNRKRFFSNEIKINETLPVYTLKSLELIKVTIQEITKNTKLVQ